MNFVMNWHTLGIPSTRENADGPPDPTPPFQLLSLSPWVSHDAVFSVQRVSVATNELTVSPQLHIITSPRLHCHVWWNVSSRRHDRELSVMMTLTYIRKSFWISHWKFIFYWKNICVFSGLKKLLFLNYKKKHTKHHYFKSSFDFKVYFWLSNETPSSLFLLLARISNGFRRTNRNAKSSS